MKGKFIVSILVSLFLLSSALMNPFIIKADSLNKLSVPVTTNETGITPTNLTYTTENPVSSSFILSKAPKLGGTAELTFEIDDIRQFREDQPQEGLANAKAWVDFYWTDIHGSYTEARSSTQIAFLSLNQS